MKKIHLAFYKAKMGGIDDRFIDRFSGQLGYSHCELVIDKNTMIGSHYKANGVKKFYYNDVYNSKYWDIYEIDLEDVDTTKFAEDFIGTPYDKFGVVLTFFGFKTGDPDKMWCSEFLAEAINTSVAHGYIDPLVMPNELLEDLINNFGATKLVSTASGSKEDLTVLDKYGRIAYG